MRILVLVLVLIANLIDTRPVVQKRLFVDPCVESFISSMKQHMSEKLFNIFEKSFPNTLDTTVFHHDPSEPLSYIITGDIPAMWLRDSTNQVIPYLRIPDKCEKIKTLVQGLINMQAKFIMLDPYTNAFVDYYNQSTRPFYLHDNTYRHIFGVKVDLQNKTQFLTPRIWERKWEVDSLAAFLRLSCQYFTKYSTYDFVTINYVKALKRIMQVIEEMIRDDSSERKSGEVVYQFWRDPRELPQGKMGKGAWTGLIRTGFRPSDDPNEYVFNIPGNAMMATFLQKTHGILSNLTSPFYRNLLSNTLTKMKSYSESIRNAIYSFGILRSSKNTSVFAYQIDGLGKFNFYDDANLPSLISLPYLGFIPSSDQIYKNTRQSLLSNENRYFFSNVNRIFLKGIGSSHTAINQVWPLAVITQALTSDNSTEIAECLEFLKQTSINDQVHEAVNINSVRDYTREWFAWANGFFGELIIDIKNRYPELLMK